MRIVKSSAVAASALVLGALTLGGCATKGFVREQVGVVAPKFQSTDANVQQKGGTLQTHGKQLAELDKTSRAALERATAAGKLAEGKFEYTMVLSDDSVKFNADSAKLSPEAETRLLD